MPNNADVRRVIKNHAPMVSRFTRNMRRAYERARTNMCGVLTRRFRCRRRSRLSSLPYPHTVNAEGTFLPYQYY